MKYHCISYHLRLLALNTCMQVIDKNLYGKKLARLLQARLSAITKWAKNE
jgi:hypothetical protein